MDPKCLWNSKAAPDHGDVVPGRWGRTTAVRKGPLLKPGSGVGLCSDNNLEGLSINNNGQRKKNTQVINVPDYVLQSFLLCFDNKEYNSEDNEEQHCHHILGWWWHQPKQEEDIVKIFQKIAQVTLCLAQPPSEFLSKVTKRFAINIIQAKVLPNILIRKSTFIAAFWT